MFYASLSQKRATRKCEFVSYDPNMGLREKKAKFTRDRIVSEAIAMFERQGYAETTMESIAEAAEIHPATLYRYFPTKDLIVFADFSATASRFAVLLESLPLDMPIGTALMQSLTEVLTDPRAEHMERRLIRSIIDQSPAARARVWDLQDEQRRRVAAVITAHTGRSVGDYEVVLSARLSVLIAETAADIWRESDGTVTQVEIARDLARTLSDGSLFLPDPEA